MTRFARKDDVSPVRAGIGKFAIFYIWLTGVKRDIGGFVGQLLKRAPGARASTGKFGGTLRPLKLMYVSFFLRYVL